MDLASLLDRPHLSVLSCEADSELARIRELLTHKMLVDGRSELEELLGKLLAVAATREQPPRPKTLDLIGHSTPGKSLLTLGDWVIDARNPTVTAFFRELAEQDVLGRLGINALRLIGCETADTGSGRWTMRVLSEILGVEVFGTRTLIYSAHYDRDGLSDDVPHVLVAASDLRHESPETPRLVGTPYARMLDIDVLPAVELHGRSSWPRRLAVGDEARAMLSLVRRDRGLELGGLLAQPSCEVVLPATRADRFHVAQVLFDGGYVRVYPDGDASPGVVYPVEDPHALRAIVDRLPNYER